jgi:pyruvate,water dikinase
MYQQLGYRPSPEVCEHGFLELICGRIYADPERLAQLFFDGLPLRYDPDALVADRSLLDRAPTTFDAQRADGRFLTTLPVNLAAMWRISRRMRRRGDVRSQFVEHVLPAYLQYVERERARNLAELDERQLLAELDARIDRVLHDFGPQSLRPGFFGGLAYGRVESRLQQIVGPAAGAALANDLTRALEGDTTFEQDALLYDVASGKARMAEFLEQFGHRATGEMELSQPRWREAPQYLESVIARWRNSATRMPVEIHTDNAARRCAAERELPGVLQSWGGSSFREEIERDLAEARRLLPFRESGKHYLMQGYELIRLAIEDLARRWELGGDIYFLRREELRRWPLESTQLKDQIVKRRTRWQAMQRLELPDVIDSSQIDGLGLTQHVAFARELVAHVATGCQPVVPQHVAFARELVGRAIASGVATGRARVVFDPLQSNLEQGDILVCPSTDPGWTPLFLTAGGLVIERGGVLSHGAIVARDFGIPAVACPHATRALRDGDRIRVDGNTGRVHVLSRENGHV